MTANASETAGYANEPQFADTFAILNEKVIICHCCVYSSFLLVAKALHAGASKVYCVCGIGWKNHPSACR